MTYDEKIAYLSNYTMLEINESSQLRRIFDEAVMDAFTRRNKNPHGLAPCDIWPDEFEDVDAIKVIKDMERVAAEDEIHEQ